MMTMKLEGGSLVLLDLVTTMCCSTTKQWAELTWDFSSVIRMMLYTEAHVDS